MKHCDDKIVSTLCNANWLLALTIYCVFYIEYNIEKQRDFEATHSIQCIQNTIPEKYLSFDLFSSR